jgi:hypothetical protein
VNLVGVITSFGVGYGFSLMIKRINYGFSTKTEIGTGRHPQSGMPRVVRAIYIQLRISLGSSLEKKEIRELLHMIIR